MISFTGNNGSIQLPTPELGDYRVHNLRVKIKRAMDDTIYAYRMGSPIMKFNLEFNNVPRIMVINFIVFLHNTAGQFVTYNDFEGNSWSGHIINAPQEFHHEGRVRSVFELHFEVFSVVFSDSARLVIGDLSVDDSGGLSITNTGNLQV